ncbi:MAG: NAD(P)/FAD-dependent oxidoreductase [Nevskia sp.]
MNNPNRDVKAGLPAQADLDVVIVGAGFAGLYMLHRMRGLGLKSRVFERGSGVGGTWFWNRYPGARCDTESMEYSYQFSEDLQQEWVWPERYSAQPDILKYANHVADRFELRPDLQFNTKVLSATFDETRKLWTIVTDDGVSRTARYFIMATGTLSIANKPQFKGLDSFKGKVYYTSDWPHEGVDFSGQRVGVIGTGSSAIQSIPHIAEQAVHLTVFQRTPNFSVPANNRPLTDEERSKVKANYRELRNFTYQQPFATNFHLNDKSALAATAEERRREYEDRWNNLGGLHFMATFNDLMFNNEANATAAEFICEKIRGIVKDPAKAEILMPKNGVVGCKRLCSDTGYFETFNRSNVALVDVSQTSIDEVTAHGVSVAGEEYPVDDLVFATGFDAMTGALLGVDIRGRRGRSLREKWSAGPRTYLGLLTVDFPNLFFITGPGSPSVLSNMMVSIDQHVNFITETIEHMQRIGAAVIEPQPEAEDHWVDHVNEVAGASVYPSCNSWYLGSNVPGKARVFMPYLGFNTYVEACKKVVAGGYAGFSLSPAEDRQAATA